MPIQSQPATLLPSFHEFGSQGMRREVAEGPSSTVAYRRLDDVRYRRTVPLSFFQRPSGGPASFSSDLVAIRRAIMSAASSTGSRRSEDLYSRIALVPPHCCHRLFFLLDLLLVHSLKLPDCNPKAAAAGSKCKSQPPPSGLAGLRMERTRTFEY